MRIAAETLKRYPWARHPRGDRLCRTICSAVSGRLARTALSVPCIKDWDNGDLGQRSSYVLSGLVDYYRYSGDPAAIAHMTLQADFLVDYCSPPADHPWPSFLVSVPTRGTHCKCDPNGMIQLDIVAEVGKGCCGHTRSPATALVRGGQALGRLAGGSATSPGAVPWARYANPESAPWKELSRPAESPSSSTSWTS